MSRRSRSWEFHEQPREEQLAQGPVVEAAYGRTTKAHVAMIRAYNAEITELEAALTSGFEQHPDAGITTPCQDWGRSSAPGCWASSGTTRTATATPSLAGTTPARRRSRGPRARVTWCWRVTCETGAWPTRSINGPSARSPGARAYYDELRGRGKTHRQAIRQLANRWVGILHACLEQRVNYDEDIAWKHRVDHAA